MAYGLVVEGGLPVAIFDLDMIRARPAALAHDTPAGGLRITSRSVGMMAAITGRALSEAGEPNAAAPPRPSRLLRRFEE